MSERLVMKPIATKTFTSGIVLEGSWGTAQQGTHESTMELYFRNDATGYIEWDIPALDNGESYGLWFDIAADGTRTLADYDGGYSLPIQAIEMLVEAGVVVPDEFHD